MLKNNLYNKHLIIGLPEISKETFKKFLIHQQKISNFKYTLTVSLDEWLNLAYTESLIEGVRPDILVAQAIHETGFFNFSTSVSYTDNNFGGLGVTNIISQKNIFPTAEIGIRAQVQHLKAYACTDNLKLPCVDKRFDLVKRGCAPYLEDLAGKWAVPGFNKTKYKSLELALIGHESYGQNIYSIIERAKKFNNS